MTSPSNLRDQKERREIIAQDQKLRHGDQPATLFARARAGLDDNDVPGGRYAAQQNHFPGEGSYPAAAGWTRDAALVPNEPPLGVAIDQQECTGEAHEVAASLDELAADQAATEPLLSPDESEGSVIGGAISPLAEDTLAAAPLPVASGNVLSGGSVVKRRKI